MNPSGISSPNKDAISQGAEGPSLQSMYCRSPVNSALQCRDLQTECISTDAQDLAFLRVWPANDNGSAHFAGFKASRLVGRIPLCEFGSDFLITVTVH